MQIKKKTDILNKSHRLSELSNIVLMHHERYDGKGYPTGTMYDPIIGRYVLDNWEEVISVVKNGNACEQ